MRCKDNSTRYPDGVGRKVGIFHDVVMVGLNERKRMGKGSLCLSHVCAGRASRPSSKIPKAAVWLSSGVRQRGLTWSEFSKALGKTVRASRTIRACDRLCSHRETAE